jgi:hypothetical protein
MQPEIFAAEVAGHFYPQDLPSENPVRVMKTPQMIPIKVSIVPIHER